MKRTLAVCVGLHAAGAVLVVTLLSFLLLAKGHPLDVLSLVALLVLGVGLAIGAAFKTQRWLYRYLTEPNRTRG